tara:strand:+ start:135 stop:263 length:129 start_codon:yes stop_codon:yes gene_type:complete
MIALARAKARSIFSQLRFKGISKVKMKLMQRKKLKIDILQKK